MEKEGIDITMNELLTLDPSLREHEAAVRAVIAEMCSVRPEATIDPEFRTGLRARLMLQELPVRSPFNALTWWAFRIAPIGAAALLMLVLTQPSPVPIQTTPMPPDSYGGGDTRTMEGGDTMMEAAAPTEQQILRTENRAVNEMDKKTESTMSMNAAMDRPASASRIFTVSPQPLQPRIYIDTVTTDRPGFIVVDTGRGEGPLGVSPLITGGITHNVPVNIGTPETVEPYSFYAYFQYDNGDRISNEFDITETDEFGNTIWVLLDLY